MPLLLLPPLLLVALQTMAIVLVSVNIPKSVYLHVLYIVLPLQPHDTAAVALDLIALVHYSAAYTVASAAAERYDDEWSELLCHASNGRRAAADDGVPFWMATKKEIRNFARANWENSEHQE